jgi:hypothetical protein
MISSYAYRLVGYENFEEYTSWADGGNETIFLAEAAGDWQCNTYAPPTCIGNSGGGAGIAGYNIGNDSGTNQYMAIYALGGTCTGTPAYFRVWLNWNHELPSLFSSFTEDQTYTIKFMYHMTSAQSISTCSATYKYLWHTQSFRETTTVMGINTILDYAQGGVTSCTPDNDECRQKLRTWYYSTLSTYRPANATCDVNDGNWHEIKGVYNVQNGTNMLMNWSVYVDNVICEYEEPSTGLGGTVFMTNVSGFRVQGGYSFWIDNLSIWEANISEHFTGNISNATPECNDGIDNDNDSFTDYPADPSCSSLLDTTESPYDFTECSDAIDNDGDGFIDYLGDPSCTSIWDTTETPFDYTQCNNGIDDDLDGKIDLADPCCFSLATTTESCSSDSSMQNDTTCLSDYQCVLHTEFPYSESFTLHGWSGTTSHLNVYSMFASEVDYVLLFNNTINSTSYAAFNVSKVITNPNIYDILEANWGLYFILDGNVSGSYSFFINLYDSEYRAVLTLRYNVQSIDANNFEVSIDYKMQNGSYENIWATTYSNTATNYMLTTVSLNQATKEMSLSFDPDVLTWATGTFNYTEADAAKVNSFNIENDNFNSYKIFTALDNLYLVGGLPSVMTICDSYSLPVYLQESFNGYLDECGWVTTSRIYNYGQLILHSTSPTFVMTKTFGEVTDAQTRYVTATFDLNIQSTPADKYIDLRFYDHDYSNFFIIYAGATPLTLYKYEKGAGVAIQTLNLSQWYHFKIVFDMLDDRYDIYIDNVLINDNGQFTNELFNLQNIYVIKFTNIGSDVSLDNILIYSSDGNGNTMMPNTEIHPAISNTTMWCGLLSKTSPACNSDSDCTTGMCMRDKKCSTFDYTYCDENGYVRGNKCIFAGAASCFFENTSNLLFDNFLYTLVGALLLIVIVYLAIMLRRR